MLPCARCRVRRQGTTCAWLDYLFVLFVSNLESETARCVVRRVQLPSGGDEIRIDNVKVIVGEPHDAVHAAQVRSDRELTHLSEAQTEDACRCRTVRDDGNRGAPSPQFERKYVCTLGKKSARTNHLYVTNRIP